MSTGQAFEVKSTCWVYVIRYFGEWIWLKNKQTKNQQKHEVHFPPCGIRSPATSLYR